MALIGSEIQRSASYLKNEEHLKSLLHHLSTRQDAVRMGGGKAALEKQRKQGKMTARERIERLVDPGTPFLEVGLFAAWEMYEEYGGAPSSGTAFGTGKIHGRDAVIVANDATVKPGAWFPMTCKKNLRAQEIAIETGIPIIYLVDTAGVFLPLH